MQEKVDTSAGTSRAGGGGGGSGGVDGSLSVSSSGGRGGSGGLDGSLSGGTCPCNGLILNINHTNVLGFVLETRLYSRGL